MPENIEAPSATEPISPPEQSFEQPSSLPKQHNFKNTLLILGLLILVGILTLGAYVLGQRRSSSSPDEPLSSSLEIEETQPTVSSDSDFKLLTLNTFNIPYPSSWIPIFSSEERFSVVYFSPNPAEASRLAVCAETNNCQDFSLKLTGIFGSSLPANTNLEDFLKNQNMNFDLENFDTKTITGYQLWTNRNASKQETQVVVTTQSPTANAFLIAFTMTGNNLEMQDEVLSNLDLMKIINIAESAKVSDKKAFEVTLTSVLDKDYFWLIQALKNNLAPIGQNQVYFYTLHVPVQKVANTNDYTIGYPSASPLNYSYLLLTDNALLLPGTYATPQLTMEIKEPTKPNLALYLDNPKYCQQDSDCVYRANFCTAGAYNEYHQYQTPWGCGPISHESQTAEDEQKLVSECQTPPKVSYDSLKCLNNTCTAVNPQITCEN